MRTINLSKKLKEPLRTFEVSKGVNPIQINSTIRELINLKSWNWFPKKQKKENIFVYFGFGSFV